MPRSLSWIEDSMLSELLGRTGLRAPRAAPVPAPRTGGIRFGMPQDEKHETVPPPESALPPEDSGFPGALRELADLLPQPPAADWPAEETATHGMPPLPLDPDAPLSERLETFLAWVVGSTGGFAAFVADADGLPLANKHGTEDHIAITSTLDKALRPIRASVSGDPQGSVAIELDTRNVLQVLWGATPAGRVAVGLVLPESLAGEVIRSVRASLRSVFNEPLGGNR
jgi:hypothetical protein